MAYHILGKIRNTKKIAKYIVDDLKNSIISNLEITLKTFIKLLIWAIAFGTYRSGCLELK